MPVRIFVTFFRWYTLFVKIQLPQMKPVYCAYITIYTATFTCLHQIPRQRNPATIQGYRCLTYLAVLWIRNIFGTLGTCQAFRPPYSVFKITIIFFLSLVLMMGWIRNNLRGQIWTHIVRCYWAFPNALGPFIVFFAGEIVLFGVISLVGAINIAALRQNSVFFWGP